MIYQYKTERISPKDFSNHQHLIELFKDLRDSNINPKEVLKDQTNFKPDLGQIKKGSPKSRSKDQTSVVQHVENVFDIREKIFDYFRDYSFLLFEAKYKTKYGSGLKILSPKQMLQRLPIALAQVKVSNDL